MSEIKKYQFIDLFCGCGGFSKGFENAGLEGILAVDIWKDAVETYQYNFKKHKAVIADLSEIDLSKFFEEHKVYKDAVDIIIGGPPCQGFSLSGKRDINDPRNKLYKAFVATVAIFRPKVFVLENVPGIVKLFKGAIWESIQKEFENLGYNLSWEILSSECFGVPQIRKRVFLVGINKQKIGNDCVFEFPIGVYGKKKPIVTTKDAIEDLNFLPDNIVGNEKIEYQVAPQNEYQRLMTMGSKFIYNHVITLHTDKTKSIISLVPDGGNYKDLPVELQNIRKVNIAWTRMNSKQPSFTIDTGHNHHFHYSENRVPTVRESARIQSFPDTFVFKGKKMSQLKQVGNAVPPLLAEGIAKKIKELLDGVISDV